MDMVSDVENADIMLGCYSRDDERNNDSENETNLDSGSNRPQKSSNLVGEGFRSFLNTNSRENNETTIETTRMISKEISNKRSRKLNEIETSLNSQVQDAMSTAIVEKVLPSIQNTLEEQERFNCTMVDRGSNGLQETQRTTNFTLTDRRSSGLQRNCEVENNQKTCESRPRKCLMQENC